MAVVKIKADTIDAQKNVQKLKSDVDALHKAASKRSSVKINGNVNGRSTTNTASKNTKSEGSSMGEAMAKASGLVSTAKELVPVIGALGGVTAAFIGFERVGKMLLGLPEKIGKYMELIEPITKPAATALGRGDSLDALDDERRSHNTASIGDEKAWQEAFKKQAGVNAEQLLQRGQSFFDMAISGSPEEMEKAWKILAPTGLKFDDLQNNSTWENLIRLIEAYAKAGEDGINELEPVMQKIFGRRGMDAIRKAGDGSQIRADYGALRETYAKWVEPNEAQVLALTNAAEMTRAKASIIDLGIPAGGESFITKGAEDILDVAKMKYDLLGDNREKVLSEINPISTTEDAPKESEPSSDISDSAINALKDAWNYHPAKRLYDSFSAGSDPEYEGLFQWDKKRVPGGIQYKSFDPIGQTQKALEGLFSANTSNQNTENLIRVLERNTTTTDQLNTTMQHLNGNTQAVFA